MTNFGTSALLQIALSALATPSAEEAEQKLASIITSLEQHYGENQKEVAAELQRLAKEIEVSGQSDYAIEFKQRTTEIMLRISMERRRGLRESRTQSGSEAMVSPPATPAPTLIPSPIAAAAPLPVNPRTTRANLGAMSPAAADTILGKTSPDSLFDSIHYVVQGCSNFETELHFYTDVLKGKISWHSDDAHRRAAAIRLLRGPELILVESQIPAPSLNVYTVTAVGAAREKLESYGYLKRGELKTPLGAALIFSGPDGNTLAIIAAR